MIVSESGNAECRFTACEIQTTLSAKSDVSNLNIARPGAFSMQWRKCITVFAPAKWPQG
jgi:hypothetical protein